ncbi:CDGSH iron-sulfur domain-containing protein [Lentzea chajnantorensis]
MTDPNVRRVTVVPNGPVLVEGPVSLEVDGQTHTSDRFVVAVCACRRSKRYPFCDTSHRKRVRSDDSPAPQADSR